MGKSINPRVMNRNKDTFITKTGQFYTGCYQTDTLGVSKSEDNKNVQTTHTCSDSQYLGSEIPLDHSLPSDHISNSLSDTFIKISNL